MTRLPHPAVNGFGADDLQDVESPELTVEELAEARPFAEMFPHQADSIRRVRGAQTAPTKVQVTLRLDREVIERFRATGKGWQSRINEALKRG